MITGELKNDIDKLWTEFWQGGIANPLTVVEQITYLMFMRLLDIEETRNAKKAARTKKPFKGNFLKKDQDIRWQNLMKVGAEEALELVRDRAFPHMKRIGGEDSTFAKYMSDATFMVVKPQLLVKAVELINELPLEKGDTKGDLYEYLLSKLTTAGVNGQFRTPRHLIRMMVDLVDPQPGWKIADPACGTLGFLVESMKYVMEKNTSPEGIITEEDDNQIFTGDLLSAAQKKHLRTGMFTGFDFDVSMLRIASMNMMMHGVENPHIEYMDTLSNRFAENNPKLAFDHFDLILANPPFKGSLDYETVHKSLLSEVKTKKTELLFLVLMLRMLKLGGRCAVVVPDGVTFGSSKAHKTLRKMLVEENQLEAVINLPSGVFKPYAGVSTSILMFTKGGQTEDVFFFDVEHDGYSLDDKRDATPDKDDLPLVLEKWQAWKEKTDNGKPTTDYQDRTAKAFSVPASEIAENSYDLSINRYKEIVYEVVEYDPPQVILGRLRELEKEIGTDLAELEEMLK